MKPLFFYSLPPAGNKIPIHAILCAIKASRQGDNDKFLDPIKDYLGTRNLLYLSSGRAALWLIMMTLAKLRPDRTEVIVPAFTCPAVASAVLKAGLKPVLCDNNLLDFGLSGGELAERINKETLAVVLVHLFGYPANILEVQEICRKHGVLLVEDAAQAFGNCFSDSENSKLGLLGDAGFFSFGRGKPLSLMHGGVFIAKSEEIFDEANSFYQNLNHEGSFRNLRYGLNVSSYSLLSNPFLYWIPQRIHSLHLGETIFESEFIPSSGVEMARSVACRMLKSIEMEKEVRQANSEWYSINLSDIPWVQKLPSSKFPYLRYPLLVKDREMRNCVLNLLMSQGTGAALFYPSPLNELPGLQEVLKDETVYTNARRLSDLLITLPVHSGVTAKIRNRIRTIVQHGIDG